MEIRGLILAIVFAAVLLQGVRGRLWHTYVEEFWHSNGW
jgi:hypothetical protein